MLTKVVTNNAEFAFTTRSISECNKRYQVVVCYHTGRMVLNVKIGGIVLNAEVAQKILIFVCRFYHDEHLHNKDLHM